MCIADQKVEEEPPAKLLDDLFKKTKTIPCIYWLALTEEQVRLSVFSCYMTEEQLRLSVHSYCIFSPVSAISNCHRQKDRCNFNVNIF
jgi:hypothetical protein